MMNEDMIKPPHANPDHPLYEVYNAKEDDYPESEADTERLWRQTGGVDKDGNIWLTPRMARNAKKLHSEILTDKVDE